MNLEGKAALVTGGTMGIGAAVALELAARGANLSIVARNLGPDAHDVQRRIEEQGRRCFLVAGDLTRPDDCESAVDQTVSEYGRLDVLVHNAGGPATGSIDEVTPEQWRL